MAKLTPSHPPPHGSRPAHDRRRPALSAPPDVLKASSASSCASSGGGGRAAAGSGKVLGWPKICKVADVFLWKYSYKWLKVAQLLGQVDVFLTCWLALITAAQREEQRQRDLAAGHRVIRTPLSIFCSFSLKTILSGV